MAVGLGNDPRDCAAVGVPAAERVGGMEEGVAVLRKLGPSRASRITGASTDSTT